MTEEVSSPEYQALKNAGLALDSLTVYRQLLDGDRVIGRLRSLINYCISYTIETGVFLNRYGEFFAALADSGADSLEDYLIEAILFHDNSFTRGLDSESGPHASLAAAAAHDLGCLQQLVGLVPAVFKVHASKHSSGARSELAEVQALPEWQHRRGESRGRARRTPGAGTPGTGTPGAGASTRKAELIDGLASGRWSDMLESLIAWHRQYGAGIFARYRAFNWNPEGGEDCLQGISDPDPINLSDLIGYEDERADVIENTLQFLDGWPANNVLLYGDRGTGKSSTVKALLNEYHERGLRLVEVPKTRLFDFPEIIRRLRGRREKFIIFVDDLSFVDGEDSYTALKAVLEGGLEHRPGNVLIYATSNRRHLIRERFSDREGLRSAGGPDEVHAGDTVQEKLSLADRFGITVIFSTPDQDRYLEIVEGIAARRGLRIDRPELHRAALNWECWHNIRSPRTARQFVDWLEGKIRGESRGQSRGQQPTARD
jgi:predicted AAA+ superfamily ATPase